MAKSNIFHFLNIYDNITSFRTHHTYKDNKIGRSVYIKLITFGTR